MAYFNGEALREGSLCQVRERHRLPNSMHAPRACLAVLRSAAVEFEGIVSVRDQVHDVHWGKWGGGVQLEEVVVNLSFLCAFCVSVLWPCVLDLCPLCRSAAVVFLWPCVLDLCPLCRSAAVVFLARTHGHASTATVTPMMCRVARG